MNNLEFKINAYVGRAVDFTSEAQMRDDSDGSGPYIDVWNVDGIAKPTDTQLDSTDVEASRLLAHSLCISKRKVAYNALNQDEMRFDDQRDSTTTWVDAVNAIKAQFPKPS